MKNLMNRFNEILEIHKQRNLLLKEIEADLGFDMSFSEEDTLKNALEVFKKELEKEIAKEVSSWMK
tara:strand:+ start:479 stop:676 length:198 start_codon:yes stop_codon:yes gene_type:complete